MLTYALLIANWLFVIVAILLRSRRRKLILLDPAWAFLIGYFINYCLKPVLFLVAPAAVTAYGDQTDLNTIEQLMAGPLGMALVFFICFMVADLSLTRQPSVASRFSRSRDIYQNRAAYEFFAVVLIFGGVIAFFLFARTLAWSWTWSQLFSGGARNEFMTNNEGNGIYIFAMHLSQLGWCMFCFNSAFNRGKVRLPELAKRSALFCVAFFVPLALGQRFGIIIVTTAAIFLLGSSVSRILSGDIKIKRLWWAVAFAVIAAGPLGLVLKERDFTLTRGIATATSAWDSLELGVLGETSGDWKFLYGRSYFEDLVYSYVPRTWVEKPERYGIVAVQDVVAPIMSQSAGTYPPGMVLEAYVNFGWYGVVFVPMLIAAFLSFVRQKVSRGRGFWLSQSLIIWVLVASFRGFGSVIAQCAADSLVLAAAISFSALVPSTSPGPQSQRLPYGREPVRIEP